MNPKDNLREPWLTIPTFISVALLFLIYLEEWNTPLFLYINALSAYGGDALWANITLLGDTLVTALLVLPWIKRRPDIIWTLLFAGLAALLISHGLKALLQVPRPPAVLDRNMFHIIGPALTQKSFPSGHTTTVFTFAFVLILYIPHNGRRAIFIIIAFLIGLSRIAVGVHWPLDILGGMLTGIVSAIIGLYLFAKAGPRMPAVNPVYFSIIVGIAALVLIFVHHTRYPQAYILQVIIGTIAFVDSVLFIIKRRRK